MNNSFKGLIDEANSILILLAERPNFDEVAAGLGLYLSLRGEKSVDIVCPSEMIVSFNRLVGVNKISTEVGNKNLVIRFKNYQAKDIEKVSYDIVGGEFQLTVSPKSGFKAPNNEQVELKHSGIGSDTIILIGGRQQSDFSFVSDKDMDKTRFIHIGVNSLQFGRETISLDRPASSISELAATLIREATLPLDPDIATNLLMGIEEGSENFASPEVNADTFAAMSELMRAGGRRIAAREIPDPKFYPAGSIPGKAITFEKEPEPGESMKEDISEEDAPSTWFEPKIYKGTSVS